VQVRSKHVPGWSNVWPAFRHAAPAFSQVSGGGMSACAGVESQPVANANAKPSFVDRVMIFLPSQAGLAKRVPVRVRPTSLGNASASDFVEPCSEVARGTTPTELSQFSPASASSDGRPECTMPKRSAGDAWNFSTRAQGTPRRTLRCSRFSSRFRAARRARKSHCRGARFYGHWGAVCPRSRKREWSRAHRSAS
jgi:hypothetical protein